MATHASAEKAARQAKRRQLRNTQTLSHCKTVVKKLRSALTTKFKTKEEATKELHSLLNNTQKILRKAASKRVMRPETVSRQIGRLSAAVHKTLSA